MHNTLRKNKQLSLKVLNLRNVLSVLKRFDEILIIITKSGGLR